MLPTVTRTPGGLYIVRIAHRPRFQPWAAGDRLELPNLLRHDMRVVLAHHTDTVATLQLTRWHWWDSALSALRRKRDERIRA